MRRIRIAGKWGVEGDWAMAVLGRNLDRRVKEFETFRRDASHTDRCVKCLPLLLPERGLSFLTIRRYYPGDTPLSPGFFYACAPSFAPSFASCGCSDAACSGAGRFNPSRLSIRSVASSSPLRLSAENSCAVNGQGVPSAVT